LNWSARGELNWLSSFFYNSQKYLESQDFRDMLAGNAPIVVTKIDGRVHVIGTALPLEQYLQKFESTK
jgi:hypothetical protein